MQEDVALSFTIADYILRRLTQQGANAIFGVPAVYCAAMFDAAASTSGFRSFVTSSDLVAGYAADGYARVQGISLVSVAYGVGTLSLLNAIAGAYIERSPVVVINGGPSQAKIIQQTETGILFSHSMGLPHGDLEAFRPFTCFCERATSLADLPAQIDRAFVAAITKKHPVYLEIPQAWLGTNCAQPTGNLNLSISVGTAEATAKRLLAEIKAARSPMLIVGVEIERYGLATSTLALIDKLGLRWTSTLLAKATLPESHPKFLGVFNGEEAPRTVLDAIQRSDLVIALGAVFGSGHGSTMLGQIAKTVRFWDGQFYWKHGNQPQPVAITHLISFLNYLASEQIDNEADAGNPTPSDPMNLEGEAVWDGDGELSIELTAAAANPTPVPNGLTYDELFQTISEAAFLDAAMTVVADTFLGIYPAAAMRIPSGGGFICSALWASIGHSLGAAIGVGAAGGKRAVVVCGDGGAQMTMEALSTMVAAGHPTIVVLVDNGLYGYEQFLLRRSYYTSPGTSPLPFAVLNRWEYVGVAKALGIRLTRTANSPVALRTALADAKAFTGGPSVVVALVQSRSLPRGL